MVERCERFRFALETSQPLRVAGERVGQDLDRHLALQIRVGGLIDLAHAAGADRGGDLIRSKTRSGWRDIEAIAPTQPQTPSLREVSARTRQREPPGGDIS